MLRSLANKDKHSPRHCAPNPPALFQSGKKDVPPLTMKSFSDLPSTTPLTSSITFRQNVVQNFGAVSNPFVDPGSSSQHAANQPHSPGHAQFSTPSPKARNWAHGLGGQKAPTEAKPANDRHKVIPISKQSLQFSSSKTPACIATTNVTQKSLTAATDKANKCAKDLAQLILSRKKSNFLECAKTVGENPLDSFGSGKQASQPEVSALTAKDPSKPKQISEFRTKNVENYSSAFSKPNTGKKAPGDAKERPEPAAAVFNSLKFSCELDKQLQKTAAKDFSSARKLLADSVKLFECK